MRTLSNAQQFFAQHFDRRLLLVCVCFLLSGFAALVYQTAWTQRFALVFGTSDLAVAAVLAAYMAGLAAGAALAGRWLVHVKRPVLVYALLELGIALGALAVPFGIALASQLHVFLLGGEELSEHADSFAPALFYLGATFVVLFVPTSLMGASLPVLARYAVVRDDQVGSRVGMLYTVNTAGAVLGTLVAAYGLLPTLGLAGTVLVGAAVNLVVFLLAALLARGLGDFADARLKLAPAAAGTRGVQWVLPLMFVSGFIAFVYEVLWTRLLSNMLGGTLYAFATMLATFLCGIALGAAVAAPIASTARRARFGFAVAQLGIALCSLAAFAATDYLAGFASALSQDGASFSRAALLAGATLLPSALFMGATFPFAVRMLAAHACEAGRAGAQVFAWNTCGAILGAVAAGFVMLPGLGFAGSVTLSVAVGVGLAALAALGFRPRLANLVLPVAAAFVVLLIWPPQTPLKMLRTSPMSGKQMTGDIEYLGVGRSATVMLLKQRANWRLTTNGLPESSVVPRGGTHTSNLGVAHWLGALPVVSRPDASSMLVIGFGAGLTLEAIAPSFKDVRVIELEREVIRANRVVAEFREFNPFTDPRIKIHLNDARGALQLTRRRFDAIVSQPSHPWTGGASNLFTREFFRLVRERLTSDGVYVQWVGLSFIDEAQLRALLAALTEVFPHVEMFMPPPGGGLLFLSSVEQPLREASVARGLRIAEREWWRMGVLHPSDIYVARVLDGRGTRRLASDVQANRDDRNLLRLRPPGSGVEALNPRSLIELVGDADSLLEWQPVEGNLLPIRRLLENTQLRRAQRIAQAIADPALRTTALALCDLQAGRRQAAEKALWRALRLDPENREALYALLRMHQRQLISGAGPEELSARLLSDRAANSVMKGLRLASGTRSLEVRELESDLREIGPADPLFSAAVRLRVAWRLASGSAEAAREGFELLEPLIRAKASTRLLWIRTRLAFAIGDPQLSLGSLEQLARYIPPPENRRPMHMRLVSAAKDLLHKLDAGPQFAARTARVEAALSEGWNALRDGSENNAVTDEPDAHSLDD